MIAALKRLGRRVAVSRAQPVRFDGLPNQMSSFLNTLVEGVLVVDPEGRVMLSNEAAQRLLSLGDTGLSGRCVWEVVRQPALQPLIRNALQGQSLQMQELSVFVPDERVLQIRAVRAGTHDHTVVVVFQDVTGLRHLERVRQDFVANVSHELRTPLTSIKGFIETLLGGAIDDPAHNRQFLQLVEEDVNRLARLTDDLLELSKAESLGRPKSLQSVDVVKIIHEVIATLTPQMKAKRLTVNTDRVGPLPHAKGDPDQLRQVFWNLLDNAIKYNVEGGTVTIHARYHKTCLYVEVADSGIGIPTQDLPRIFERFYRVDKARSRALGGTGLGLSIVKHIVEAHGGEVTVDSQLGRGSTFRVRLSVWQP